MGYKILRSLFTIEACASKRQAWCKMICESAKTVYVLTTRNKCCDKSSPMHARCRKNLVLWTAIVSSIRSLCSKMTETIFLEKQSPGYEETSGNDQADHSEERRIPTFEVDAVILRSLMRMQTGFEMKTLARTAEKGANNLLHSISLNSSFVANS